MLISLRHNFVLIAMPKCGSTALEAAFTPFADVRIAGNPRLKHTTFSMYEKHILPFLADQSPNAARCEPFSVFREPMEWLFSWFSYRTREQLSSVGSGNATAQMTFSQFLDEYFKNKPAPFARVGRQSRYIKSMSNRVNAVTLYRYEDIDSMAAELARRIGKNILLPQKNVSPQQNFHLAKKQLSEARDRLKKDYEIYESIPVRQDQTI